MSPKDFSDLSRRLAHLRRPHEDHGFDGRAALHDPFDQFAGWMSDALEAGIVWPNAMTLATADSEGRPSARMVLLKGFDARGFVFFSNYGSRKGRELAQNPRAALVFYWQPLERQVRVEGAAAPVAEAESRSYFESRPRGSRLSAWASPQSEVIEDRVLLERRVADLASRYPDDDIPLPPHWGGYRLAPESFEFWQGRRDRLHDRLGYRRTEEGGWLIERLAP